MRKSFKDSLKALEADIQFANTLLMKMVRQPCLFMREERVYESSMRGITDVDDRKQKEICAKYKKKNETDKGKLSEIDLEREEECGICLEINSKVVLPKCNHSMCMKCYRNWRARSQSCPFCRDSIKRVNSGDLWIYTSSNDIVDLSSIARENLKRLFIYIDKLPLIVPDPRFVSYDPRYQ